MDGSRDADVTQPQTSFCFLLDSNGSVKYNKTFMRKVPQGTEAHVLLLGELPTLGRGTQFYKFNKL